MLEFHNTLSTADLFNAFVVVATAAVAVFFTLRQLQQNRETQRAIFLRDLYLGLFSDPDRRQAFYWIDGDRLNYTRGGFHGALEEGPIDQLLTYVDAICALYQRKMLTEREMEFFIYYFGRIYGSWQIRDYLMYLEGHFKELGTMPFSSFVDYCQVKFVELPIGQKQSQNGSSNANSSQLPQASSTSIQQ